MVAIVANKRATGCCITVFCSRVIFEITDNSKLVTSSRKCSDEQYKMAKDSINAGGIKSVLLIAISNFVLSFLHPYIINHNTAMEVGSRGAP